MSLIVEDKEALNSLANIILSANGSNEQTTATKFQLEELIKNIIPNKSKFASGVVIPTTEITIDNMPEINYALGNDENGSSIIPDTIIIYQPESITNTQPITASVLTSIFPKLVRTDNEQPNSIFFMYRNADATSTGRYVGGSINGANAAFTTITDNSFYIAPHSQHPWQAKPIVWMQIKY